MASVIVWKGQTTNRPGVYSQTTADRSASVGAFPRGAVAVVGIGRSLKPGVVHEVGSDATARGIMADCELRRMIGLAFNPTNDDKVVGGGASKVYVVCVNPMTLATKTFLTAAGTSGVVVSSARYGQEGNRIGARIRAATNHLVGKRFTFSLAGRSYDYDDLGGNADLALEYTGGGLVVSAMTAEVVRGSAGYVDVAYDAQMALNAVPLALQVWSPDATKMAFDGKLTFESDTAEGPFGIIIVGTVAGVAGGETLGYTPDGAGGTVTSVNAYDSITSIDFSAFAAGAVFNVTGSAAKAVFASHPTIQDVTDYLTGKLVGHGYTVASTLPDRSTHLGAYMDQIVATDITAAELTLWSIMYRMVAELNVKGAGLISAAENGTVGGIVANTAGTDPVYLVGGDDMDTDGVDVTATEWTAALALLRKLPVTAGAYLTNSATYQALLVAHVEYCDDRNEQQWWTGIAKDSTKAQINTRALALSNPYLQFAYQDIVVDEVVYDEPYVLSVELAGMHAGMPIGTPLTWKRPRLDSVSQAATINPDEDAQTLTDYGVYNIVEDADEDGILKIERDMTTYRASAVPQFQSTAAVCSWSESKRDARRYLKDIVGNPNFDGSDEQLKTMLVSRLRRQANPKDDLYMIKGFRSVTSEDLGEQVKLSYECVPIEGIQFVTISQFVTR